MVPAVFAIAGASETVAFFNFNDGFQDWTPQTSSRVKWEIREIAAAGEPKSFSDFDPEDVSSLFTTVPITAVNRDMAFIMSPEIQIPANASLDFYAGFSTFYDYACRLLLEVSTDNFSTFSTLWKSTSATGSSAWQWRRIELPLSELKGEKVRFRFYYTGPKSTDNGGYGGDFAIDNFRITAEEADDPAGTDPDEQDPGNNNDPDNNREPEDNGVEAITLSEPVTIYNAAGVIVYEGLYQNKKWLPSGIYILRQGNHTSKIIL